MKGAARLQSMEADEVREVPGPHLRALEEFDFFFLSEILHIWKNLNKSDVI